MRGVGSIDLRGNSERKYFFLGEGLKVKGGTRISTSDEFRFSLSRETETKQAEKTDGIEGGFLRILAQEGEPFIFYLPLYLRALE